MNNLKQFMNIKEILKTLGHIVNFMLRETLKIHSKIFIQEWLMEEYLNF